jgi:hypothetical protein
MDRLPCGSVTAHMRHITRNHYRIDILLPQPGL